MAGDIAQPDNSVGIDSTPDTATTPSQRDPAPPPAQPDTSKLPIATQAQQDAATSVPTPVTPVRRHGLAGIVDEVRDALAGGNTTTKVYQDANGDKYIKNENLTGGQKWMRIASTALHGAAAGYAAGRGGNHGGALQAGVTVGDKAAEQKKNEQKEAEQEVNTQQLEKFNMIKLKHDAAAAEFRNTREKVLASQNDVKFAQEQQEREKTLGSADLGVFADPASLTKVKEQNPDFWKDVYANRIVTVPELDADGTRHGIHVYLRTQGIGGELVPQGSTVYDFVPPAKPGDEAQLVPRKLAMPATHDQLDAWNNSALAKKQAYDKEQADIENKKAETGVHKEQINVQKSEENKNNAAAAKDRGDTAAIPSGNVLQDNAEGLADGRLLMGKDIPTRTRAEQTSADTFNAEANKVSKSKYGLPYSPEIIRQESKFANEPKTQAYLNGVDRMIGVNGEPGQVDKVLEMAKAAHLGKNAPINSLKLWIKEFKGDDAAKNFEQYLSDTQTALGTLIGNPLLGSGESDKKLALAQKQFGQNPTLSNLENQVNNVKEILGRSKTDLMRNNRYIQQRYGEYYGTGANAKPQPNPTPQPQPQNVPTAPAGKVTVQIPGQPFGFIPQGGLDQFKKDHPDAKVYNAGA